MRPEPSDPIDRSVLPIDRPADPYDPAVDIRDQDPAYQPSAAVRPPEGAPNVLVVLLDDMGFGAPSAFGGPCAMPTADRLAADGLCFTRFHTTAICSSTRASLLTGRNHHAVGYGYVVDQATPAPGYNAELPLSAATLGRVLRDNGYRTGAFGKMHQTPRHEVTSLGPFDRWPTGREGFERFYGFMGGEINHWHPALYDGTTPVEQPCLPEDGYHLTEDLVDRAIGWIRDARSADGERPFFCYLPLGATHAPFHVRREWVEKHRGRFDHGWNEQRERTLARQKQLGIVPPDTILGPWPENVPEWSTLSETEQRAACALMELYAGFTEHTDVQVGRLVDALAEMECLDDTIVLYVLGDNGASPEGGITGTLNEYATWNRLDCTAEDILQAEADGELGGESTWPHFPVGWAIALDTPYQYTKQIASHFGGTRNGLIVHWPDGIEDRGSLRHQWHHVIDVMPTILELAGIPLPSTVDGVAQDPVDGVAMGYAFADSGADERHTTQYFEIGGSRGIYHDGWVACTAHRTAPWDFHADDLPAFEDDVWELYDTRHDWSQAEDLAAWLPDKLAELQALFLQEARRNRVLPLDDRSMAERRNAPDRRQGPSEMTFHRDSRRVPLDAMPNVIGRSHVVSARIAVDGPAADGVICAQGGRFSGWSLYLSAGRLTFCHNVGGAVRSHVRATEPLGPGTHELRMTFCSDGGRLGAGGTVRLTVDGREVGSGRVDRTVAFMFPIGEDFNVGVDPLTPVSDEYPARDNAFPGEIAWVRIEAGEGEGIDDRRRDAMELATQ